MKRHAVRGRRAPGIVVGQIGEGVHTEPGEPLAEPLAEPVLQELALAATSGPTAAPAEVPATRRNS